MLCKTLNMNRLADYIVKILIVGVCSCAKRQCVKISPGASLINSYCFADTL